MTQTESKWYWTDDLARLLIDSGQGFPKVMQRWIASPVAVRGEGEAIAIAEALLDEESEEVHKAA